MHSCILHLKQFLEKHHEIGKPILFGFSGGSDSLALLFALLECKDFFPLKLHLIHIDHGWREESRKEAESLQLLAQSLHIPFYSERLDLGEEGNLEEKSRIARLQVFEKYYHQLDAQGLLLAHHLNDQAETVLKRIFEGAHLLKLSGMQEISKYSSMAIWRPWIDLPKEAILDWIRIRGLCPIEDPTNQKEDFLRARMRKKIFPFLNQEFQKEIASSLAHLSDSALELKNYFQRKLQPLMNERREGVFGVYYDLTEHFPLEKVEIGMFLQEALDKEKLSLSRQQKEILSNFLIEKAANRIVFENSEKTLYVDRGRLFVLQNDLPDFEKNWDLYAHSEIQRNNWKLKISCRAFSKEEKMTASSWKDIWQGNVHVVLPKNNYQLEFKKKDSPYHKRSSLKKWWLSYKIPSFLYYLLPTISQNGVVVHEFLSGKKTFEDPQNRDLQLIELAIKNSAD